MGGREWGNSAVAWICGFALPFRRKETVRLLDLWISTVTSKEGDSAVAWILGAARPFRRKDAVQMH